MNEEIKRPPIPSFDLPPDLSQDDDDNDEVSVDSTASFSGDSNDSSSEEDAPLSLEERMLRNQQRNAQFLESLHEKYGDQVPVSSKVTAKSSYKRKSMSGAIVTEQERQPRGMLRKLHQSTATTDSLSERLQALLQNYPQRHGQIRRLMAILSGPATVPVFVSGPRGVGKTTIVRDVVHALDRNAAYINCKTLEPFSMERLVADVLKQLRSKRRRGVSSVEPWERTSKVAPPAPTEDISNAQDTPLLRSQPRRAAKVTAATPFFPIASFKTSLDQPELGSSSHSSLVSLGRGLQRLSQATILIVDHAERLPDNGLAELLLLPKVMGVQLRIVMISRYAILMGMRLDALASSEKSSATLATSVGGLTISFPAYQDNAAIKEVLKAPKILPLIIGKYKPNQGFLSKVVDGFLTSLVQFLSDTTNDINEYVRIGNALWPHYIQPLNPPQIQDTLKSLGVTSTIDETVDGKVLGLLGRRFLKEIGKLSSQLTLLPLDSHHGLESAPVAIPNVPYSISHLGLPFLRACLLLACFICQNNRANTDRKIFSVNGNGKRRKTRGGGDELQEEDLAFASTGGGVEQLKSLRPRPFLVERVFSIFVTLVRLNPDATPQIPGMTRLEYMADDLGGTRLYEDLHQLVDLGLIHPVAYSGDVRGEQINFNSAKFWCSLTPQEASNLAQTIGIPLDSYLV